MGKLLRILLTLMLMAVVAFPLLYAISCSFFTPLDFTDKTAHLLPSEPSLQNYKLAIGNRWYPRYVLNSVITASVTCISRLLVTILAAFSFSHFRFKGSKILLSILLSTMFVPSEALLYENYLTIARLGLVNTYSAIVLPSVFAASTMLLLLGYFQSTDKELFEAAKVDGAGDLRYLSLILLPLSAPVILILSLQTFINSFNSYLWPLLVTTKPGMRTVQVGISMLGFYESGDYGAQYAAILLITLPFLVLLGLGKGVLMKNLSLREDL